MAADHPKRVALFSTLHNSLSSTEMSAPPSPTLSDSALLDSLAEDPHFDLSSHRERRLEELKEQVDKVRVLQSSEYGRMVTYGEEKRLIERMSKEKYCLVNFYHPDFQRCRIMDQRLEELAPKHPHTLFLRTSVADAPFLVAKFGVQVLPCVMVFVDSRCVDRLIGFEELGDTDRFTSSMLDFRLQQSGVFPSGPITLSTALPTSLLDGRHKGSDDESEEDQDGRDLRRGARRGKTGIRNGFALN